MIGLDGIESLFSLRRVEEVGTIVPEEVEALARGGRHTGTTVRVADVGSSQEIRPPPLLLLEVVVLVVAVTVVVVVEVVAP